MRYKNMITDKLISIQNGMKELRFYTERGEVAEYRAKEEKLNDIFEEVYTLLNTNEENY